MRIVAVLAVAVLAAGCASEAEKDPFASIAVSDAKAVVLGDLVPVIRGAGSRYVDAAANIYPDTLDFIKVVRQKRSAIGDDRAEEELTDLANSLEGWCARCVAAIERELERSS